MLTTTKAAQLMGVARITVLKWIERGHLPAVKHGRDWMIAQADLDTFTRPAQGWPKGRSRKEQTMTVEYAYKAWNHTTNVHYQGRTVANIEHRPANWHDAEHYVLYITPDEDVINVTPGTELTGVEVF